MAVCEVLLLTFLNESENDLKMQLFSDDILRFWRTGADRLVLASEDDESEVEITTLFTTIESNKQFIISKYVIFL